MVRLELITAIEERDQDSALAMAQRPIEQVVLDGMFGEQRAHLHTFALLHGMPQVALTIFNREDFTSHYCFMGGGQQRSIMALHLAAALGDTPFCEAFMARRNGFYRTAPVLRDTSVTLANGDQLDFVRGATAIQIARSRGHHALYPVLEGADQLVRNGTGFRLDRKYGFSQHGGLANCRPGSHAVTHF